MSYELSTNRHALLSNIELRTMSEESNSDAGLWIIESEVELEERRILGGGSLIEEINAVRMTDIMPNENDILESEVLIPREDGQSQNNLKSLMGSFLFLNSEQSSEGEGNYPIVSTTSRVKILKFEDTLSKENHRQFEIIYESLLLEGKAGNLTKSTFEVVLAQKPPTWLQVIHEKLKHLIISSETFWNRRKMEHGVRIETKLDEKNRLLGKKGQKGLQIRNSSYSWPKDKSTKNSIIGIIDDQFC